MCNIFARLRRWPVNFACLTRLRLWNKSFLARSLNLVCFTTHNVLGAGCETQTLLKTCSLPWRYHALIFASNTRPLHAGRSMRCSDCNLKSRAFYEPSATRQEARLAHKLASVVECTHGLLVSPSLPFLPQCLSTRSPNVCASSIGATAAQLQAHSNWFRFGFSVWCIRTNRKHKANKTFDVLERNKNENASN